MSDAISESFRHIKTWDTARKFACMYFGKIPLEEGITKESIEEWIKNSGRTPEKLKEELEKYDLFWWLPNSHY